MISQVFCKEIITVSDLFQLSFRRFDVQPLHRVQRCGVRGLHVKFRDFAQNEVTIGEEEYSVVRMADILAKY